jgi:GTP pyrophosphokinase
MEKVASTLEPGDEENIRQHLMGAVDNSQLTVDGLQLQRDLFGLNPIVTSLQTALLVVDEIGLRRDAVLAVLLRPCVNVETDEAQLGGFTR